ncbi:MAG: MBL fold metallo-hydrolase [Eubacteriales bacterium]
MYFIDEYKKASPKEDEIALIWVGQAGFIIKNANGKVMAIDLYLSDLVYKMDGNKRLMMSIIEPCDVQADVILASHSHADHLDMDSLPTMMQSGAKLICCTDSYRVCEKEGFDMSRVQAMTVGDKTEVDGFKIEAVFCEHGDYAPEAIGFIIEVQGIKIYFAGDTSYQMNRMAEAAGQDIDLLLVPINGEYGNMNARDAAMMAEQVQAKITVPCHFGTFARHLGDPYAFDAAIEKMAPHSRAYIMTQGEILYYSATGDMHN